jgi:hypothetical protein
MGEKGSVWRSVGEAEHEAQVLVFGIGAGRGIPQTGQEMDEVATAEIDPETVRELLLIDKGEIH